MNNNEVVTVDSLIDIAVLTPMSLLGALKKPIPEPLIIAAIAWATIRAARLVTTAFVQGVPTTGEPTAPDFNGSPVLGQLRPCNCSFLNP